MKRIRTIEGIIPPYLQLELIKRNPNDLWHSQALAQTHELWHKGQPGRLLIPDAAGQSRVLVYDAKGSTNLPGSKARFEPEGPISDEDLNAIYDNTLATRKFHKDVLGINSMDNRGMDYINTGHFGVKYNNAFNNGVQMAYGDGDKVIFKTFVLLDIDAHEKGHQVTKETCNLTYEGQSGALNESLSDVDGVTARQYTQGLRADQDSWLVAPGIFMPGINGVALRSMTHPGTAYDDPRLGKDPQPAHMSAYVDTDMDNGGVHLNSGIPNRAYAVFAIAVGGQAWQNAYPVWWQTRKEIRSDCDFQTFANKTVEVCKRIKPESVKKLVDAWNTVGITVS